MAKQIEIIKNFLDKDFFKQIQNLILVKENDIEVDNDFAWFQRKQMVTKTNKDLGYFTHSFYNNNQINSNYYSPYIKPILEKLDCKAVIQVRANLTPSSFYKEDACEFHIDYPYQSKTAILYLNTCNGGTEFKVDDKIEFVKAEENKIVIFDTNIQHRGTKSTDQDFRYIINFNYF
jgi:hypothetical protein